MTAERSRVLHVGIRGLAPAAGRPDRPPIILLHAFPLDSRMWRPLVDELERRGAVAHAFDAPGFGSTPLWPDEPSIDAVADGAVRTLRDGIGARSAHWVGCSMGGYVALALAERHPDAVAGLGLVDTRSTADDEARRAVRLRMADELDGERRLGDPRAWAEPLVGTEGPARGPLVAAVAEIAASASPDAVAWGQRAMAGRPDRTEVLRNAVVPGVVVWGERDTASGIEEAEVMGDALGVTVSRIPGVGHLSPFEAPGLVADALAPLYEG